MPYSGPLAPSGLGTILAGPTNWTNPNAARNAENVYATCANTVASTSYILKAYDFQFNIPINSEIRGIQVELEKDSSHDTGSRNVKDSGVFLYKDNVQQSVNKANTGTNWSTTEVGMLYGVSGVDLWGTTWTPEQINSSGFGVGLTVQIVANTTVTASVDKLGIIVFYAEANKPGTVLQSQIFNPGIIERVVPNRYNSHLDLM
jgi:hypothetical protein